MRKLLLGLAGLMLANAGLAQAPGAFAPNLDFRVEPLGGGEPVYLCREYAGRVVLIVNTASKCAFTDQYADLEALHDRYRDKGLAVLGFPSNDFGSQEPGDADQIKSFCRLTYSVEFPMFAKSHVRAGRADPLYERLAQAAGEYPQWNFHKYLLGRDGELVASFPSHLPPDDPQVTDALRKALAASSSPEN